MAKNAYPNTSQQPLQTMDFRLVNENPERTMLVRTMFKPKPDPTGTQVAHVDLDYTNAGSTLLYHAGNTGQTRTVIQAGVQAYQIAQKQAQQAGNFKIVEVLLGGEEFLEKADVEQITGNTIPVRIV